MPPTSIIDSHAHFDDRAPFGACDAPADPVRQIHALLERFEIERCVLSACEALLHDFRDGNRIMARHIAREPGWYGYITLNPNYLDDSLAELEQHADQPEFVGIKEWPVNTGASINSTNGLKLIEFVACMGWHLPILLHTYGAADARAVLDAARQFPNQPIIMGHMGGAQWHKVVPMLAEAEDVSRNVYLEPCCSHPDADKIRLARDLLGPDRILFGTDLPIISPAQTLGMIDGAELPYHEKRMILHDNAMKLFRFAA